MTMINSTEESFHIDVLAGKGVTLVDFWAEWCGPCKRLAPFLENLQADNPELNIVKVSVDECPALAQKYGVRSIPHLVVIKDGEVMRQFSGNPGPKGLADLIKLD